MEPNWITKYDIPAQADGEFYASHQPDFSKLTLMFQAGIFVARFELFIVLREACAVDRLLNGLQATNCSSLPYRMVSTSARLLKSGKLKLRTKNSLYHI